MATETKNKYKITKTKTKRRKKLKKTCKNGDNCADAEWKMGMAHKKGGTLRARRIRKRSRARHVNLVYIMWTKDTLNTRATLKLKIYLKIEIFQKNFFSKSQK